MAKAIQICGTGSGVGKSVIAAGFCRIFLQDGFRVAPFKAQNMALNSFVTREGGEMGRAQAVQAQACRIPPHLDMNPILIKPSSDTGAQIILQGRPIGNMSAVEYKNYKPRAKASVLNSFNRLKKDFEVIVIEGAGSPAEINLRSHDIVNMEMAEEADAPVILVGDIDKGGVFAWLVGTLELLTAKERKRIKGFIINKFRGDKRLLKGGLDFLEKKTGIPVLGVIPYFRDIKIPEEDSVSLEIRNDPLSRVPRSEIRNQINIAVLKLPHMSNFTDFDPLENEPDVNLQYTTELDSPDVVIIPGTKNTMGDLKYLQESGLAEKLLSTINYKPSTALIGICGGYQMLGRKIRDRYGVESKKKEADGLGLLPIVTDFKKEKILKQVRAEEIATGLEVRGYEIHHGRTDAYRPVFKIDDRYDGNISDDGRVWGTYIHGVFDEDNFRRDFLNRIRRKKGLSPLKQGLSPFSLDREIDKLAVLLRENIDMDLLYKICNYSGQGKNFTTETTEVTKVKNFYSSVTSSYLHKF